MDRNHIHSGPPSRNALRAIGPVVGLIGLGLLIAGGAGFLSASAEDDLPNLPWYLLSGIALLFVGAIVTQAVFAGKVARNPAQEMKEEIGTVADAIEEDERRHGSGDSPEAGVRCYNCGDMNLAEARICVRCGQTLVKSRMCPNCGELNDPHAKFCAGCCHVFK